MRVMNNGSQMHTVAGMIDRGESVVDDKKWAEMLKLPAVKKAMEAKRLKTGGEVKEKAKDKPAVKESAVK